MCENQQGYSGPLGTEGFLGVISLFLYGGNDVAPWIFLSLSAFRSKVVRKIGYQAVRNNQPDPLLGIQLHLPYLYDPYWIRTDLTQV